MNEAFTRSWTIDFKNLRSKESMLKKIAAELAFPAHFGRNLDALYDCLTDLPLVSGNRYEIRLEELERGPAGDGIYAAFSDARDFWADAGVGLALVRE